VWQATAVPGDLVRVVPPRPLTEWEKRVVARLAPDAEEAAINALRVTDRCGCGCSSVGFSDVAHFSAAEAEAVDSDGTPIWVMLFADRDERVLATLDVFRADSQPIQELPAANDLVVTGTSPWTGSAPANA
jgi:hypothetical protein